MVNSSIFEKYIILNVYKFKNSLKIYKAKLTDTKRYIHNGTENFTISLSVTDRPNR
jgi:hypothetical protein